MARQGLLKRNAQIYEEACEWFVEFRTGEPDLQARRDFRAWLEESPAHMSAYLDVTATWTQTTGVDLTPNRSREQLIAEALADTRVVSSLPTAGSSGRRGEGELATPAKARRVRRHLLAAAVATTGVGVAALWAGIQLTSPTYSTDLGEQRSIVLPDGSTVSLNSRSSVRVRYTKDVRAVDLIEGQALFQVAKSPARPFVVSAGEVRVRAVGTQFDVNEKHDGTRVTVVEGRVAVFPAQPQAISGGPPAVGSAANHPADEVFVAAGEQLDVSSGTARKVEHANIAGATSWTRRQLVFEDEPLGDVAEEFNRYNAVQIVIRDPALADFKIDGVFSSTDPASFVRFLRARPEMSVTETDREIVIGRR